MAFRISLYQLVMQNFFALLIFSSYVNSEENTLTIEKDYECVPETDCQSSNLGDKVPDPHDCHAYYLCIKTNGVNTFIPSDNPIQCPKGQYFNHATGDCKDENGVPCKDNCLNLCATTCKHNQQVIAYPGDCTKYYICLPDLGPAEAQCPNKTYFNGNECSDNINECCDNCTPYCDEAFKETMDPHDCESYYICTSKGVPSKKNHYQCGNGQYFKPSAWRCEDNIKDPPCQTLCPN